MSVTHRVLYVGIGGTGVHIGKKRIALRRDLCGPDGKALIEKAELFKQSLINYQIIFNLFISILMMTQNKFYKKVLILILS